LVRTRSRVQIPPGASKFLLKALHRANIEDWTKYTYIKKVRTKIPDIFTRQEILKMIETAQHPMDKALISALYETGCRIGEITTEDWE
jgi:integrase